MVTPAPPSVTILPATEEDLPAIEQLAGVIWRAVYPEIISSEQIDYMLARMYSPEVLRRELQSGIRFVRLLAGNELAGFASFGPTDEEQVMKLHKLYLHPRFHGRGLGSRLLQHCEQEIRRLGARRLVLNVNRRNARAIAAYQRNNFRIVETVLADIGNGFVMDDYIMAKDLPD
jgi:ribosomal protein S18 acetylase RimI-like enzyme